MMPHPIDNFIGLKRFFTKSEPPCTIRVKRPQGFRVFEIPYIEKTVGTHLYVLLKKNIDTFTAIAEIAKRYGGTWCWGGLKDSSAITLQYVCSDKNLENIDISISQEKCLSLRKIGKGYINIGMVKENIFLIDVEGKCPIVEYIKSTLNEMKCVPGIYAYQRFGTRRPISHIVGKLILKGRFAEAVDVILGEPTPWESPVARRLRRLYYSEGPVVYLGAPKFMDIERRLASYLLKKNSPKKALFKLPQFRLFLNAFQAFIYNKALTTYEDTSPFNVTPGYSSWELYKEVLVEENIDKGILKRYGLKGSPRQPCTPFNGKVIVHDDTHVSLLFTLPKGYYATTILREIVKGDPKNYS